MLFKKEIVWGGRNLSIETGRFANQSNGAVLVTYGETVVLCTVVASKKAVPDIDFFPLTVNYIEKFYASGRIPGGFIKREGRPSERESLISRLIDRPIRPLFHENFKNETQIVCTVLSYDMQNDPDIVSIIGASAALTLSGLPFLGPVAAAKIGYENGEFLLNPYVGVETDLDLVIAGTKDGVLMVESGAKELSEEEMLSAIKFGHNAFSPVIDMIIELAENAAKEPFEICIDNNLKDDVVTKIKDNFWNDIEYAYKGKYKQDRYAELDIVFKKILQYFSDLSNQCDCVEAVSEKMLSEAFHDVCSLYVRHKILVNGKRIDDRIMDEVRPISVDVSVLPKTHGTAIFQRGETQVLAVATLGTSQDEQIVDSLVGDYKERFMLHYNFPSFSVGEVGKIGAPGRREVGHGKLAWRAMLPVLPSKEDFPYTMRVVSEVLSCNGSSSMATVCGASLSLMDAGVPIKDAVAGIAMGLILESDSYVILSDIMGEEDHLGDMDFKVAGTKNGITALQMDIKVTSVTFNIMGDALKQAKAGRLHILKEMSKVINVSRKDLNENAPKILNISIPKDKIREVIGSGGKVIRDIIEKTQAKIDIDDDGNISIFGANNSVVENALEMVKAIAIDPIEGEIYKGLVVKIMDFGAFVRFYGNREGLVHISEMSDSRVENVTDIMNENDIVNVKYLGCDSKGRNKLTIKF